MTRNPLLRGALAALVAGIAGGGIALAGPGGTCDDANMHAQFSAAKTAAFAEADADGDGKLTPEEFAHFHDLVRQKMEALRFSQLDTNGDGVLTQDEIAAGHTGCHHGAGKSGDNPGDNS